MTSVGYVTGSAVPENKSTQTDLVGLDSTAEVGVFPETVTANGEAAGVPEPEVTADETNIQSQPVPGADSLPAGQSETTGKADVDGFIISVGLHVSCMRPDSENETGRRVKMRIPLCVCVCCMICFQCHRKSTIQPDFFFFFFLF